MAPAFAIYADLTGGDTSLYAADTVFEFLPASKPNYPTARSV